MNDMNSVTYIKSGNKRQTDLLFSASFLVVLIAVINFINFTMALVPARIKHPQNSRGLGTVVAWISLVGVFSFCVIVLCYILVAVIGL